ncbi:MAG TPA: hypothetical protein VLB90_11415 [Pseudomonadales bacterium]|nr:hypothetical protein [Pseudomonadales bacterium]
MKKIIVILVAAASALWGTSVLAKASCSGPSKDGNTWNLVCAADTSGDAQTEYQCDYILSVTNANGETNQKEATGSVGSGLSGVVLWSNIQSDGSDITSASIVSGSCVAQ